MNFKQTWRGRLTFTLEGVKYKQHRVEYTGYTRNNWKYLVGLCILLVDSRIVEGQLGLGHRTGRSVPGTGGGVSKLRD